MPKDLVDAFKDGRAAVFVGAGASIAAGLPTWDNLVRTLADALGNYPLPKGPLTSETLLKIPQYYVNQHSGSRRELVRRLERMFTAGHEAFRARRPKPKLERPVHHYLAQLPTTLFYTTNIDPLLEEELDYQKIAYDVIDGESGALQATERRRCQVRKIHGTLGKSEWNNLVLTRSDFALIPETRPLLFGALKDDLQSHSFLFVGYSLRDPDFTAVYNNVFQRMAGKHQTHFVALVEDPGEYELLDLTRQGFTPIRVWEYPGNNDAAKISTFLRTLVRDTSELTHLRSFYRGVQRGDNIPIVITSRLYENKGYAYYPATDVSTAQQVTSDLELIGVRSTWIADVQAVKTWRRLLRDNVIIICSPIGNVFANQVFEAAKKVKCEIRESFVDSKRDSRRTIVTKNGRRFKADDPRRGTGKRIDQLLVARYANPWTPGKFIYVYAGCHALGTYAAGTFLTNGGYRTLTEANEEQDDIVAVVPVFYLRYDALAPKFDLGVPVLLQSR